MSRLEVEANHVQVAPSSTNFTSSDAFEQSPVIQGEWIVSTPAVRPRQNGMRRTPRKSLIVVLPDNHVVSPDMVTELLPAEGDGDEVDVILACAGQPPSLAALQRRVRDLQVLFAPAGTSNEDLRELAMRRAPGDIVSLLSGTRVQV
jgi:hypothetical protein